MQAIVICHVSNPGITVLLESIKVYAPTIPVYIYSVDIARGERFKRILPNVIVRPNTGRNFGDSYNEAISDVFGRVAVDSLIVANDDVVLNPQTIELMAEDRLILRENAQKVGFLGARSDYVLPDQNIRFPVHDDRQEGVYWASEAKIKETAVIAPIFATISREAWGKAKFPSTNWYSDNIICHDLQEAGYRHFVSRAYVHHAGSQTVGMDYKKCHEEPRAWIKENRPDMYEAIYG
jgi:hypothetical protein